MQRFGSSQSGFLSGPAVYGVRYRGHTGNTADIESAKLFLGAFCIVSLVCIQAWTEKESLYCASIHMVQRHSVVQGLWVCILSELSLFSVHKFGRSQIGHSPGGAHMQHCEPQLQQAMEEQLRLESI
jgi:hypothetical protein